MTGLELVSSMAPYTIPPALGGVGWLVKRMTAAFNRLENRLGMIERRMVHLESKVHIVAPSSRPGRY